MGYFCEEMVTQDSKAMNILSAFRNSSNDMLVKFANLYSHKNYDILKKVYEENDIVLILMKILIKTIFLWMNFLNFTKKSILKK